MDRSEQELVENFAADFDALRKDVTSSADTHAMRRHSVVLRRWVNDSGIVQVRRILGLQKQPMIPFVEAGTLDDLGLRPVLLPNRAGELKLEFKRLAKYEKYQATQISIDVKSPHPVDERNLDFSAMTAENMGLQVVMGVPVQILRVTLTPVANYSATANQSYPLGLFRETNGVIVGRVRVSRRRIISYVANKKDGAHFDPTRGRDDAEYVLLDRIAEGIDLDDDMLRALNESLGTRGTPSEISRTTIQVAGNAIYEVMYSTIKFLAESPDMVATAEAASAASHFGR